MTYCKIAFFNDPSLELDTLEITWRAKSLVPEITFVQAFLPSSNLEYDASVRNTSSSARAGAVSWYGSDDALRTGKNSGNRFAVIAEL